MTDVTDNFNRANGALGSNWSTGPSFSAPTIVSNAAKGPGGGAWGIAYWNSAVNTFSNDQHAVVTATAVVYVGAVVRHQASTSSGYICFAQVGSNSVFIYRMDSGTFTLLSGPGTGITINVGDTIELDVVGSALSCKISGVAYPSINVTDATYTSGQPGIGLNDAAGGDNWSAGPIVVPSSTGSASGSATVAGVGGALALSTGTATGTATVTGVSSEAIAAVGSAAGVSTVSGQSLFTNPATGVANGVSTVTGLSSSLMTATGAIAGVSTVSGITIPATVVTTVGSATGFSFVQGVGQFIAPPVPLGPPGTYRALTDVYLSDGTYIEAGTTFISREIPPVAVDPIDTNAIQAYWNLGPVMMNNAEISRALFPVGLGSVRSGVSIKPPAVYWKPAPVGFILTGAGAALGARD